MSKFCTLGAACTCTPLSKVERDACDNFRPPAPRVEWQEYARTVEVNPWHPVTDAVDLKHLGKLGEELGECSAAVARCIIQGTEEREPTTHKPNRQWLTEEIADVLASAELVIERFGLDREAIHARSERKKAACRVWHLMA